MAEQAMYTAEQVAAAARSLREAAGADDHLFSIEDVIAMLSEEVLLLRERGFTDQRVADLLTDLEIPTTAKQVGEFYIDPDSWGDGPLLRRDDEEDE